MRRMINKPLLFLHSFSQFILVILKYLMQAYVFALFIYLNAFLSSKINETHQSKIVKYIFLIMKSRAEIVLY